ncbi:MAG TPA: hypothetical protein VFR15_14735 [Chloroflexia bacterium]|nr:hypothetical protein [Chloroflexia bacterium]
MKAYTAEPEPVVTGPPHAAPPGVEGDRNAVTADAARAAQRRTDRLLLLVLGGVVALLVIAGFGVVLLRQPVPLLPADTPGGTVQRFLTAIENESYDEAYNYLSERMVNKPSREEFVQFHLQSFYFNPAGERRRIGEETIYGESATVQVIVSEFHVSPGPFGGSGEYSYTEAFTLRLDDGAWLISGLPWRYHGSY